MSPIPLFVSRVLVIALLLPISAAVAPQSAGDATSAIAGANATAVQQSHDHDGSALTTSALPPGGTFTDDNGSTFEGLIEAIAARGITKGCNPPANDRFCPDDAVTRGEMAVFLVRAFDDLALTARSDFFSDDGGTFYEHAANQIREARVTRGCNPPGNNRYCGEDPVTRGQMAAFLSRALELTDDGGGDHFDDDDNSQFENDIDRLRTARITLGCNPPDNDEFCPRDPVTRGQMAAFIARALGLKPIIPPPGGQVVTGTLVLRGNVDLSEDLIIDGGTLVAGEDVDLDGHRNQIMFMNGGIADWDGATFRNLSRIMFHGCAGPSTLRNTQIINSGTTGELGFYPLHWHLNGNCTRGTVVENVTVRGGKNHAFVPHGSHGITFRNIKAFDTVDDAFWWDPPEDSDQTVNNSNDIKIYNALIDGVEPKPGDDGLQLTAFQLGAGSGNEIHDSVARNVGGRKNCSAYHWPEDANHNEGGNVWIFEDNFGTSDCHGIFIWQNDGRNHIIKNFTGGGIAHGAYDTPGYRFINPNVPYFEGHAIGYRVEGGSVGEVRGAPGRFDGAATFVNTNVDSLRITNNTDKPEGAVDYVFNGTGLRCQDVDWIDVRQGTTVRIDGSLCTP